MSISRLIFSCTSVRSCPSTWYSSSIVRRTERVCSSVHFSGRSFGFIPCLSRISTAHDRPIPYIDVSAISPRLFIGMSIPAIRGISFLFYPIGELQCEPSRLQTQMNALSLSLFVLGVLLVNHVNASLPTNNFVVRAPLLDACPNFHCALNAFWTRTVTFCDRLYVTTSQMVCSRTICEAYL